MDVDTTYSGWTNHATWAVNLRVMNDEGLYNMAREIMAGPVELESGDVLTPAEHWRFTKAEQVRDFVESITLGESGGELGAAVKGAELADLLVLDLLTGYLGDVNWQELADSWAESFEIAAADRVAWLAESE